MGLWKKNPRFGSSRNQQNCQTGMLCYSKVKDWKCKIFIISEKLVNIIMVNTIAMLLNIFYVQPELWSSWAFRSTTFFHSYSVIKSREVFMGTASKFLTKLSLDQKWHFSISIYYFMRHICLKIPFQNKIQSAMCQKNLFKRNWNSNILSWKMQIWNSWLWKVVECFMSLFYLWAELCHSNGGFWNSVWTVFFPQG